MVSLLPLTLDVWVPATTKAQLDLARAQQGHSLVGALVAAAALYAEQAGVGRTFLPEKRELRSLMREIMAEGLVSPQETATSEPVPASMKRCRQGHLYPALTKNGKPNKGCTVCAAKRKQRQRARA